MLVSTVDVNHPPHPLLEQFFDDHVIEYLCQQTNLYASFKGKMTFSVDKDKMRAFIAFLLIAILLPLNREQSEDVHNRAVSQLMNKERFNEILRCLHLADNNNLAAGDKLAKVRLF